MLIVGKVVKPPMFWCDATGRTRTRFVLWSDAKRRLVVHARGRLVGRAIRAGLLRHGARVVVTGPNRLRSRMRCTAIAAA